MEESLHPRFIREASAADFLNHCRPRRGEIRLAPIEHWAENGDNFWPSTCRIIGTTIDWVVETYNLNCEIEFVLSAPVELNGRRTTTLPFSTIVRDDKYYICINHELIHALLTISTLVASSSFVTERLGMFHAPWMGRSFMDKSSPVPDPADADKVEAIFVDPNSGIVTSKECFDLSLRIWRYAVEALTLHEVAHIKNGHLRLLNEMRHKRVLVEEKYNIKRAMEFDADAFMCNSLLNRRSGPIKDALESKKMEEVDHLLLILTKEYSISLFLLFQILSDNKESTVLDEATHAPSIVRALTCATHSSAWLDNLNISSLELTESIISSAFATEQALPSAIPRAAVRESLYDDCTRYIADIAEPWNLIRDKLDELKLGGSIAPKH